MPPDLYTLMGKRNTEPFCGFHGGKKGIIWTGCSLALAKTPSQLPLKLWVGKCDPSLRLLLSLQGGSDI